MTNLDMLQQAYRRWHDSRGNDTNAWMELVSDDFAIRSLGGGRPEMEFSAPRRGLAEVLEYFAGIRSSWQMVFYRVDEYIEQNDRIVAVGECAWKCIHTGKVAQTPTVALWRFRDGKAVEFFEFYDTATAFAATKKD